MNRIRLNAIQQKFWMDNLLKYPSIEYNGTNCTFWVQGDLDIGVLKEAYRLIMLEYPPFHSTILVEQGVPYFVWNDSIEHLPFQFIEQPEGSLKEIDRLLEQLVYQPFDLDKEYPCRFYVIHHKDGYFLLHLIHHIAIDGVSIQSFFSRLSAIYNDLLRDVYMPVNQNNQMTRFNAWFDGCRSRQNEQDVAYWQDYVRQVSVSLPLPRLSSEKETERLREQDFYYAFALGKKRYEQYRHFCKEFQTSPFRLFSTVWALTLSRVMRVDELLLDHTVNMRGKDYANLFGVFVNNLPIKYKFQDDRASFMELVGYANENRRKEREHLFAFYSDVLTREKGNQEQVNVCINYPLDFHALALDLHGCVVKNYRHVNVLPPLDLVLAVASDESFRCNIRFKPVISRRLVQALAETFQEILDQVLACPEIKLKDIRLVSKDKEKVLLTQEERSLRNRLAIPQTFVEQFRQTVVKYPDYRAVEFEEHGFSYAELDSLSERVAKALCRMGLQGRYIGLSTPKNLWMIVGILGILKSGNVYVPVDGDYPIDRIRFIIDDCQLSAVLRTQDTSVVLERVPMLSIESLVQEKDDKNIVLPRLLLSDKAYVIYTSGTTGKPKGIPISYSMLAQTIATSVNVLHLDAHSRELQFANICFDASVMEIFPALIAGATLVLTPESLRKDPVELFSFLREKDITSMFMPPAFLAALPRRPLPRLHTIFVGGDSCTQEVIDYWSKDRLFVNVYGPTENCVDVTHAIFHPGTYLNDIGVSVPGCTCYVLDKYLHLMPDNTVGELYIGGSKLTEGYLNRPELNAEKFVLNPFVAEEDKRRGLNTRLYQTGDLVMRRPDGHLIFMGRSDFQVKLNGYRIELGDIESKILEFGGMVKNAVVTLNGQGGGKHLVAYVQTDSVSAFPLDGLKAYLKFRMPAYMIPAVIIPLQEFPYNTSGKIDRKRLPDPSVYVEVREVDRPVTECERKLAVLWSGLLPSVQAVGRDDSFIALGGDSMSVIRLSFMIHEQFGFPIKAFDIYQHITLKELAAFIDAYLHSDLGEQEEAADSVVSEVVPLTPEQFSLWLECMKSDELKDAYNLPCLFECPSVLQPAVFEQAFNRLIKVQDSFRMCFPADDNGNPYIQVKEYAPMRIEICDVADDELAGCLNRDMQVSFDLAHGPLFHCRLYRISGKRYVCSLVMHHLISDGWSAQLIQSVLIKSVSGMTVDWEGLSGSYVEYALLADRFVDTSAYARRVQFWKGYLQGASELKLPNLKSEREIGLAGGVYTCLVPKELSEKVHAFCRLYMCTPFVFYYAVYLMVLARVYRQTDFVAGFPYGGREHGRYKNVVGYFVQTLCLRYRKAYQELSFAGYLAEIKSELLEVEQNAVSFDKIMEVARTHAAETGLRLVRTMFTFEKKSLYHDCLMQEKSVFDMVLSVLSDDEENVCCRIRYRHSCFAEEDMARFAMIYKSVMWAVTSDAGKVLSAYSLASVDYCQAVIRGNLLSDTLGCPQPFLHRFAQAVRDFPDRTALVCGGKSITYQELDEQSGQVMLAIKSAGIQPDSNIVVSMQASIECIVAMVGILKAGCCYVPVAVNLPDERKAFIQKDAACVMSFDETDYPYGHLAEISEGMRKECSFSGNAYVIYTSGTTGQPKGVPVTHLSLSYLIEAEISRMKLTEKSRGLLFASISFDASVFEIFPILSVGATLVIALPEERKDPVLLAALLERQKVTFATIPPAILPVLPQRPFPSLAVIVLGGETTALSALEFWRKGRTVINAYGPTENTVDTTMCVVDDDFEYNDIGVPLPGVSCYVLDEYHNIVPDGMVGELYIGGVQLTRGYLNRPELNQEKFIENPYVTSEDKAVGVNLWLYKSGDLVRRRPDGHLIFMGRADSQVKLRGFRIELAEIETLLQQCEGVRNALVEVRKTDTQEELAAFVQFDKQASPDVSGLQAVLRGKLPPYMIPSKWAVVDEFPLTVNGKIDRRRLPEPDVVVKREVVGAGTENEETLLAMAGEVIGSEGIGVETDLLDEAGMTSMQVMEFVGKVITETGLRITVSSVYKNRTIRKLLCGAEGRPYFWFDGFDGRKPVLVFITGFPAVSPFYDALLRFFARDYSVFVFDSYYDFFVGKDAVSLEVLLHSYEEVLTEVLGDKPVAMLTGYCTGAELAIAFADYMRKKHPEKALYPILNMEGVYRRQETDEIPETITEEPLRGRIRITNELYKGFPLLEYTGPIVHVMAGRPSKMIYWEKGEETDGLILEQMRQASEANHEDWQRHYPNAPYYELDCDHWTFFEEKNLRVLREIIRKHWNI